MIKLKLILIFLKKDLVFNIYNKFIIMSRFPNRRWLVIPTELTSSIDFNQVHETSVENLRFSVDGSETFIKYEVTEYTASFTHSYYDSETDQEVDEIISAGVYGRPSIYSSSLTEYNHTDILTLLATDAWTTNVEPTGSK